jgi:O-6-methylguanine DNA methyltransferase
MPGFCRFCVARWEHNGDVDGVRAIKPIVAVFDATGYTGRFVLRELLRRDVTPGAIARTPAPLASAEFPESEVVRRQATIDDSPSLDVALRGAHAVINCAGPFVDIAEGVGLTDKMLRFFAGDLHAIDDIETATAGPPFQRRVWNELRNIPTGSVISYGTLAQKIRRSSAARAVGSRMDLIPLVLWCRVIAPLVLMAH